MNTAISIASILACAVSLDAQIAATLKRLPKGLVEVSIRNNSAKSLAAFVVTVSQAPGSDASSNLPIVSYSDPLIDAASRPLLASEVRVILRGAVRRHVLEEPIAAAGISADGTTIGEAALLTRLMLRRSNMLLAVETTLETLSDAGRHNVPRDKLIEQFEKMANSVRRWYLPTEQKIGGGLYQSMAGKLMNLPEEPLGRPFPPAEFVAQETATLRRQRVALLESQPSLAGVALTEFGLHVDQNAR
ncbi:MAG: hypothetical protein ABSE86_22320 [Bryobacteraceae bacterium]|jgi:hypothetical protein